MYMFQQFAKDYSLTSTFVVIFNFPFSENACIVCLQSEFFPHVFFLCIHCLNKHAEFFTCGFYLADNV